jgi:hypothetical protein
MAERVYVPSSGTAPVTPASWLHTTLAGTTYSMPGIRSHLRSNTALTSRTTAGGTTNNGVTRGLFRIVFGPLAAVAWEGTINISTRCSESNAAANATMSGAMKLIQPGGTDRSTMLAVTASDLGASVQEFTTTLGTRRFYNVSEAQPVTLTSQTPTAGDYAVVEIGFRYGSVTSYNVVLVHGDPVNTADAADADGTTTAGLMWVEFSQKIPWLDVVAPSVFMPPLQTTFNRI